MNLKTQKQDLEKLLITKIQECCKLKILDQRNKQITVKQVFKIVVTNQQLQNFFKHLIKIEVGKLNQQSQKKYSPQQETKHIKENIKIYIEKLIRKEFQKRQFDTNSDDKIFINLQARVNKTDKIENQIVTNDKFEEQSKVQKVTGLNIIQQNERKNVDSVSNKKRKMIKKYTLKTKTQNYIEQDEEIIQIVSQSKDQKKTIKNQTKTFKSVEKHSILQQYLFFLSQLPKTAEKGHFIFGDNVKNVGDIYYSGQSYKNIVLLIDWHQRKDGFRPKRSMVSLQEYQYYKPLQVKLLLKKIQQKN